MTEGRATYVGSPALFKLNHAALIVARAFDSTPYLVGSALERREFRDVDVRVMLDDDEFDRLFPGASTPAHSHPLWSLLCASISDWLSAATGLPVDFQVQRRDEANAQYPGPRSALGIYPCAPDGA